MKTAIQSKRRNRAAPVADVALPVLRSVLKKRGFATADILSCWPEIVGPTLAGYTLPERLSWPRGGQSTEGPWNSAGAKLTVRADGPAALELQHMAPLVIERINGFFGYEAVARISIVQGIVATPPPDKPRPPSCPPEKHLEIASMTDGVEDKNLQSALQRLGRSVAAKETR